MKVGVIGGGIMGSGIAQVAAMNSHEVVLRDTGPTELDRASSAINKSLARFVKAERLTQDEADATWERLELTDDLRVAVRDAELVIEAVPEILDLKHAVFAETVEHAPANALLASNTSQLSITQIAAPLGDAASRFIGMHFFNPPVMMKLVELIRGLQTTDESVTKARAFGESLGKQVVVCQKDSPGFITSRAYAALRLECLRILEEGLASPEDIDTALKLGFNLPMGPLELGDFNGLDTFLHVTTALENVYGERFRPTVGIRNMVAAGRLGRKTGHGFYRYDADGTRLSDD